MPHPLIEDCQRRIDELKDQKARILDNKMLPRSGSVMAVTREEIDSTKATELELIDAQIAQLQSAIDANT